MEGVKAGGCVCVGVKAGVWMVVEGCLRAWMLRKGGRGDGKAFVCVRVCASVCVGNLLRL